MQHRGKLIGVSSIFIVSLLVASCGGSEEDSNSEASSPQSTSAIATPPAEDMRPTGDSSMESETLSDAEACAFVDDLAWQLLFNSDSDTTSTDFRVAATELDAASKLVSNPVLERWMTDLANASRFNADEIDSRAEGGDGGIDLFFPTKAWDESFNSEVYEACETAGYEWR